MREIVLDTETTGFEPSEQADRIVEIGAVELFNHMPTGRTPITNTSTRERADAKRGL